MTLSSLRPKYLIIAASLAPGLTMWAPPQATAEVFFRPFGFAFHRPIAEPEPDVSPGRIAAILARRGFRLVGPLGYRGDQIVATGVDVRGARERFIIDPYEGEVLSSWRIGPHFAREAPLGAPPPPEPYGAPEAVAFDEPRVIPGIGGETRRPPQPRASTPPRAKTAAHPAGETAPRAAPRPAPSQATKTPPKPAAPSASPAPSAAAPSNTSTEAKAPAPPAAAPAPGSAATTPTVVPAAQPAAPTPPPPQTAAAPAPAAGAGGAASAPAPSTPQPAAEQPKTPDAAKEAEPKPNLGG